ncbi:hypothetical protein O181_055730 [Austropuccinia psidii MF-1]|uniref:Thaumatin-like protein n=1 Tax=Austropuccinia psidii MF-1 TaxID=1389203 RepID=A0A9Q3E4V1_9BASI|nr:hypothetical protein [Austropuccinia psidii MF-1]
MLDQIFAADFYPFLVRQISGADSGWEAPFGQALAIQIPDGWSGRFWGRRDCDFSKPDVASCSTGSCKGGLKCEAGDGTGVPPATLAEFTLNGDQGKDYYDVSNVDGANLPVKIENNKGCKIAVCGVDLDPGCPDERMKVRNSQGGVVGCLSAFCSKKTAELYGAFEPLTATVLTHTLTPMMNQVSQRFSAALRQIILSLSVHKYFATMDEFDSKARRIVLLVNLMFENFILKDSFCVIPNYEIK